MLKADVNTEIVSKEPIAHIGVDHIEDEAIGLEVWEDTRQGEIIEEEELFIVLATK